MATHAEVRAEACGYCGQMPGASCVEAPGSAVKIRAHHVDRHHAALSRVRGAESRAKSRANEELREKIAGVVSEYAIFADDGERASERIMKLIQEAGR